MRAKSLQMHLPRNPMDGSLPGSSVQGTVQARVLEWVAVPSSGDLSDPGIKPVSLMSPALAGELFTTSSAWELRSSIALEQVVAERRHSPPLSFCESGACAVLAGVLIQGLTRLQTSSCLGPHLI